MPSAMGFKERETNGKETPKSRRTHDDASEIVGVTLGGNTLNGVRDCAYPQDPLAGAAEADDSVVVFYERPFRQVL